MLDYAKALNPAQLEAVTRDDEAMLVVAGAGSGKTRVIVYRLAWLIEHGVAPESILLLTFTRKAAEEMLNRASALLGRELRGLSGGTFHAFAYGVLRKYPPSWLNGRPFTLLDASDAVQIIKECKETLKLGKKDLPKNQTVLSILGKARNKELSIEEIIRRDSFHLLDFAGHIESIGKAYRNYLREKGLLDYDDLLAELERLLLDNPGAARRIRQQYRHILVDEYQDTNPIQARITRLLASDGECPARLMAVGDEAQSIYSFRGACARNILDFPKIFPGAGIVRLEENYRSTQPILDVANDILANAAESFDKKLFTARSGGHKPRLVVPLSDASQAQLVTQSIRELLDEYPPEEIAVLFRSGYHSYALENSLRQAGIAFRKYGGLRLIEAAHIKDILSFARLAINPLDLPAFTRVASMHRGIGPKTTIRLYNQLAARDATALRHSLGRYPGLLADLAFVDDLRIRNLTPEVFFEELLNHYRPRLEERYPEDWPTRLIGLEEVGQLAHGYADIDLFVADLALESPEDETTQDGAACVTLSTVHSAKGLEWDAVLIIDLAEDRFPSRHAQLSEEDFEEERRLFYVACTRARENLQLYAPASVYVRNENSVMPVSQSPFLRELNGSTVDKFIEKYGGVLQKLESHPAKSNTVRKPNTTAPAPVSRNITAGYCRHSIFGRGKIIRRIDDEKMQVNFPGFGLKIILADYLQMED